MTTNALNSLLPAPPVISTAPTSVSGTPSITADTEAQAEGKSFTEETAPAPKATEKTRNIVNSLIQKARSGAKSELTEVFGEDYEATANIPSIALLIDRLEQVDPDKIPDIITQNPFIQQAIANPIEAVLQGEKSIAEIAEMLDLPPKILTKALSQGFSLDQKMTPLQFFKAIGIDPQKIMTGLNRLRHKLTKDGIPHYVARAKAVQIQHKTSDINTDQKNKKNGTTENQGVAQADTAKNNLHEPAIQTPNKHSSESNSNEAQSPSNLQTNVSRPNKKRSEPIKMAQAVSKHRRSIDEASLDANPKHTGSYQVGDKTKLTEQPKNSEVEQAKEHTSLSNSFQKDRIQQILKTLNKNKNQFVVQNDIPQPAQEYLQTLKGSLTSNHASIKNNQKFAQSLNQKNFLPTVLLNSNQENIHAPEYLNLETTNTTEQRNSADIYSSIENTNLLASAAEITQKTNVNVPKSGISAFASSPIKIIQNSLPNENAIEQNVETIHPDAISQPSSKPLTNETKSTSDFVKNATFEKTISAKDLEIQPEKQQSEHSKDDQENHGENRKPTVEQTKPQALPNTPSVSFDELATDFMTPETPDTASSQRAAQKVLDKSQFLVEEGGGTIFIDLQEELGNNEGIGLSVQLDGDDVRIKLVSKSEELKEKISAGLPALQSQLNDRQLKLVSVDLGTETDSQHSQDENPYEGYNPNFSQNTPFDQKEMPLEWEPLEDAIKPIQIKALEKEMIQNLENRYMPRTSTIQIHT